MIPITRLYVGEEEAAAAADAVRSGWLSCGPRAAELEQLVASRVGVAHGVSTNSCTTALHLALVAAGVGPGDEVVCPSLTFIATPNAIRLAGATPVFAEVHPRTFNLDPTAAEAAITARTRALLPVSQIGLPADLPALRRVADHHGLALVEDAAPSLGSSIDGRPVGSWSDLTCFSFDARKILTTGEGGMITTDDATAAERLRALRAHGASVPTFDRHHATSVVVEHYAELGFNYKLTDVQAAIGIVQMGRLDEVVATRRALARRYEWLLGDDDRLLLPVEPPGHRHVYQSYGVRVPPGTQGEVMEAMAGRGVATRRLLACHLEPVHAANPSGADLPVTEEVADDLVLLPLFVGLTEAEQDEVAAALRAALDATSPRPRGPVRDTPAGVSLVPDR